MTTRTATLQQTYFLEGDDTVGWLMVQEYGASKVQTVGPHGDGTRYVYGRTVNGTYRSWTVDVYESGQVTVSPVLGGV